MTINEWKVAVLHEAKELGHAEVKANQKSKGKAAQQLVEAGKLVNGGTISSGGVWYKIAA